MHEAAFTISEALAICQGLYFALTGLWAIVHIRSFIAVTGPKTDIWLVKTVGALITLIGISISLAGIRGTVGPEITFIAIASAAALGFVDVYYVVAGTISRIYLLDAIAEIVVIAMWLVAYVV